MSERKNEEKNVLMSCYGKKAFVKVKQCLDIGKVQFSFVDQANTQNSIDCYMDAEEFGAILMDSIKDKSLLKAIYTEKAKGEQYPKAVWQSPVGGNAKGNNGKPISRYFEIAPGSSSDVVLTAYAFPAEKNDTGAFIKVKGSSALLTLRVPCTIKDLKILSYKWGFLENDYMTKKYSLENMKSDYKGGADDTYAASSRESAHFPDMDDDSDPIDHSYDDDFLIYVGTDTKPSLEKAKEKAVETKMKTIRLVATSSLEPLKDKRNIKVCHVTENGTEHRLICLMDKISDKKKLSDFEVQLEKRISSKGTLEFTAQVAEKGNDLYLTRFA